MPANGSSAAGACPAGLLGRPQAVLLGKAGHDEPQRGRLHHVDGDRHRQHEQQPDLGRADASLIHGPHPEPGEVLGADPGRLADQAKGGRGKTEDDQDHADDHRRVDAHVRQPIVHISCVEVHRQVKQDTRRHTR